jgi:uncharacterized protein involved in outer membrane biogenesis
MGRKRWWLGVPAGVLLLLAAASAIALAIIDPNDLKPQLAAALEQATGRVLTLDGPLRISRSLWPTIEATNVKLANLPGGSRPDMARAERIEAQLSLLALLRRQLQLVHLTLIGPNILFEEVGSQPNWVFHAADKEQDAAAGPSLALRFRDVHVQNGMVTLRLPGRTRVVGIRSLELRHLTDDGPLDLSGVFVYSDYQPFHLSASARPTGDIADPWTTQVSFAAFDSTASAEGVVSLSGAYDLQITAMAPALEKLNALLPQMRLPALRRMAVTTHLTSGRAPGDLPTIGTTHLHFTGGDLADRVPGLILGDTDIALPAAGTPAVVAANGIYAGQAYKLTGTAGVPQNPSGRVSIPVDLALRAGASGLTVKGRLALNAGQFAGLDAGMTLRAPALAAFRPLAPALPALTDLFAEGRLVVPATLGTVSLHDMKLSAREGDLAGDVAMGAGAAVSLDAMLHSARLDLDALLPDSGPAGPPALDAPLPWAKLHGPHVKLAANFAALRFHDQLWRGVDLALTLNDGRLQVSRLNLAEPAVVEASFTVNVADNDAPAQLSLHAPGIPLAVAAQGLKLPGPLEGALQVDAQLSGKGHTMRELAASLDGSFRASMAGGGSLSNAALTKIAGAALKGLGVVVPVEGRTAINCIGLIGLFSNGVGRFPTIAVDTTYLKLSGAGQVDLRAETLALKLRPLARLSGSSVAVPVLVEGPFSALQGRLDASGLDQLGILVDSWFGGDNPEICTEAGLAPAAQAVR